jgi:hypothetical protein
VPVPADVIDTVIGASTHRDTYHRPGVRRRPGRGAGGDCDPAFVDRAGHLAEGWGDDEKVMQTFEQAHRQKTKKLDQAGLLPSVAWVHFIPDTPARRAQRGALYGFLSMIHGLRSDVADGVEGSAAVRATLGPAGLAMVDALITAGVGSSRAEVMRWAIGRISENPAYAQVQDRVRESGELGTQF